VTVRHGVNRGVAAARTTGVLKAVELGAEAVCFHDDDDHWEPERLARGFGPFADPGVAMTYANQHRIDESFSQTGAVNVIWTSPTRSYRRMLIDGLVRGRLYFPFQTAMFRTSLCRELVPFMPVRESEDLDFALRALKLIRTTPGLREVHIPEVLAYHVSSADSLSATDENNRIREGVHREIFAGHVPGPLVSLMFALSKRIIRPAGITLGRARRI
jgi:glycosyltransferase involved in cell wall biosynthesis